MGDIELARKCAEDVLAARLPALAGKDYKGMIPTLRARIAAIRCGDGDQLPEVKSAMLAIVGTRKQCAFAAQAIAEQAAEDARLMGITGVGDPLEAQLLDEHFTKFAARVRDGLLEPVNK